MSTRGWALLAGVAVVVAAASFLGGRALGSGDSERGVTANLDSPSFAPAPGVAGTSRGGFSGFGEVAGMEGHTVVSGRIVSVSPAAIVVESPDGVRATLNLRAEDGLRRIEGAARDQLRPGMSVVVRPGEGDAAAAILIVAQP
jgi:hypothetical protein